MLKSRLRRWILSVFSERSAEGIFSSYRFLKRVLRSSLRLPVLRRLRGLTFRRMEPLAGGRQIGTPVVRYYWARFLDQHRLDVQGRALEIGTTMTICAYGGSRVTHAEAIDLARHTPEITVLADLSRADEVPSDTYDCFINQFSLHLIYDVEAALYHSIRILRPRGVALINFTCVDYFPPEGLDMGTGGILHCFWSFTPLQVHNLLRRCGLGARDYQIVVYGNLTTRLAVELNQPAEELTRAELEHSDPGYSVLICARITKPVNWSAEKPTYRDAWVPADSPLQWTPERGHYGCRQAPR